MWKSFRCTNLYAKNRRSFRHGGSIKRFCGPLSKKLWYSRFCVVSLCDTSACLVCKNVNLNGVIDIAFKIVYLISLRSLQRRLFQIQSEENELEYCDLLLHTDVRWLSRGGLLERFQELPPEVIQFLDSRWERYNQLSIEKWLHDLSVFTYFTNHLNILNLELQGKNRTITELALLLASN